MLLLPCRHGGAQELEELFGTRPAAGPQAGTPADAPPSPADAAPDGSSKSRAAVAASAAGDATSSGVHTAAADGVDSSAQGDEFRVRESEPKPTESPQLAHPAPTTSGRLTHVDKQGRAAMVDVGKVSSGCTLEAWCVLIKLLQDLVQVYGSYRVHQWSAQCVSCCRCASYQ